MQHAKPIPKNLLPARNMQHGWAHIVFFQAVLISTPFCSIAAVFMTLQVLSATTDGGATINTS
jgi:hypothetical protein